MSTRIRYVYTGETCVLVSKQFYIHPKDGSKYQIKLLEADKQYQIIEDMTGLVVAEGKAVNMHQVKQKAKDKLVELGISFEEEDRNVKSKQVNS